MRVWKNGEGREFPVSIDGKDAVSESGWIIPGHFMRDLGYTIGEASPKPTLAEAWADGFAAAVSVMRPGEREFYEAAVRCGFLANPYEAEV